MRAVLSFAGFLVALAGLELSYEQKAFAEAARRDAEQIQHALDLEALQAKNQQLAAEIESLRRQPAPNPQPGEQNAIVAALERVLTNLHSNQREPEPTGEPASAMRSKLRKPPRRNLCPRYAPLPSLRTATMSATRSGFSIPHGQRSDPRAGILRRDPAQRR